MILIERAIGDAICYLLYLAPSGRNRVLRWLDLASARRPHDILPIGRGCWLKQLLLQLIITLRCGDLLIGNCCVGIRCCRVLARDWQGLGERVRILLGRRVGLAVGISDR